MAGMRQVPCEAVGDLAVVRNVLGEIIEPQYGLQTLPVRL